MKMRHDMVTGIVGLLTCIFFFIMTQQVRQPANLLEPGPRLLPYVAIFLIGISSIALIVKGYKEREIAEKPYFPKGGVITGYEKSPVPTHRGFFASYSAVSVVSAG